MTEDQLHRLSRKDLLEMMIAQEKEMETLKKELDEARKALKNREIAIDEAGSIAVAALQINGIFEAAQAASQQYIENIQKLNDRQSALCAERDADSKIRSERLLKETAEKCLAMEAETSLQQLKILKISTKIAAKSDRKNVDLTAVSLDWTIFQPSKTTNSCLYYT